MIVFFEDFKDTIKKYFMPQPNIIWIHTDKWTREDLNEKDLELKFGGVHKGVGRIIANESAEKKLLVQVQFTGETEGNATPFWHCYLTKEDVEAMQISPRAGEEGYADFLLTA